MKPVGFVFERWTGNCIRCLLMTDKKIGEIDHCHWQFKFQCPQRWDILTPTEDPSIKMCEVCLKQVYLCETDEDVVRHAKQDRCVAVLLEEENECGWLLGEFDLGSGE